VTIAELYLPVILERYADVALKYLETPKLDKKF
jgi:hypothetical protein